MFWNNYFDLCSTKGMSPNAVAKELGISSGTVTGWKNGRVPHHNTLIKIADYFGVTVDYLLGKTEKPAENGEPKAEILDMYTDHEKTLVEAYRGNPDMQRAVDRLLGIEQNDRIILYTAAVSEDHHKDQYIAKDKEEYDQIKGTPNTKKSLL